MINNDLFFAKVKEEAKIPTKRSEDMGYDVYACFDEEYIIIKPHETKLIPTGIASACSEEYGIILKERGSTGTKGIGQRCGVIDSGYRNEWFTPLTNTTDKKIIIIKQEILNMIKDYKHKTIKKLIEQYKTMERLFEQYGDNVDLFMLQMKRIEEDVKDAIIYPYEKAICQAIVVPVPKMNVKEISYEELKKIASERGNGALGSSGK